MKSIAQIAYETSKHNKVFIRGFQKSIQEDINKVSEQIKDPSLGEIQIIAFSTQFLVLNSINKAIEAGFKADK